MWDGSWEIDLCRQLAIVYVYAVYVYTVYVWKVDEEVMLREPPGHDRN